MGKSIISIIAEKILKITKPKYMDSYDEVNEFIAKKSKNEKFGSSRGSIDFHGMEVACFGKNNRDKTILYIHGGAYINEFNFQHKLCCFVFSHKLNAKVIAPLYPLAPNHKCSETFELITELYKHLTKNDEDIILMGDSAGGGFVLSFCQYLNSIGLKQPSNIIVFSPWVDISLSGGNYEEFKDSDPILGEIGLREIGKSWAGDFDTHDFKVSPLFGDNSNLAKTLIFTGTNELFYPDIVEYFNKLKKDGVNARLIEGEGLFHIYPLFPVPESKSALKEIKNELEN